MAKKFQSKLIKSNQERHMVITPKFRVSFPQLFEAKSFQNDPDQKKEFKVDMLFDSEKQLSEKGKSKNGTTPSLKEAIRNVMVDQWGADQSKWPKFQYPVFKNGNERQNSEGEIYQGYEGKVFCTAKSGEKYPPKVVLANGKPAEEADVYGGCYAQAAVLVRPYIMGNNKGITLKLLQVRKLEDGESFGGFSKDLFDITEEDEEGFDFGQEPVDGEDAAFGF